MQPDPVARALNLLVQSSRVSPPLREAVATVEAGMKRLTAENAKLRNGRWGDSGGPSSIVGRAYHDGVVAALTAERDAYQAALNHAAQGLRDLLDANATREHEGMSRDDWDAAILKAEVAIDTANGILDDITGGGWTELVVTVPARAALEGSGP